MPIKIFIDKEGLKGGPAIFKLRLVAALKRIDDIEIVTNVEKKFDIGLEFIRKTYKYKQPYILRASSCYYFKGYKPWNNKPIAASIKKARYIIFQSKFAYELLNRVLRLESRKLINNNYSIIYNGIDVNYINSIESSESIEPNSFITCARWDGNKRIHSIIKGFLKADVKKHLYIIGGYGIEDRKKDFLKLRKKYKSKYIHILGEKSNREIISIMKACKYQIHLAFIDICPNVVIEGLGCGLNVLCTNLGGTPELVKNNGIILNVDKFWKTKYLKKRIEDLDKLKSKVVGKGVQDLLKRKTIANVFKFNIDIVAEKYVDIFRKII